MCQMTSPFSLLRKVGEVLLKKFDTFLIISKHPKKIFADAHTTAGIYLIVLIGRKNVVTLVLYIKTFGPFTITLLEF